ncbi:hypothetical protein [Bacillus salipaludis]|uniref:Knr4/Smi1-like domain-containing protein n=1 Tax=Bacillus salipaludis TaxID=2547811 RepID=A0AA90R804_9BACI|nr:hypothetical protein [Bacillus salipaludis]MDQ6597966.1 hypothetical protein [Bacillus salipaludis]
MDFNNLNDEKEPAVVSVYLGVDWDEQPFDVIADDFGDFLLELIKDELE